MVLGRSNEFHAKGDGQRWSEKKGLSTNREAINIYMNIKKEKEVPPSRQHANVNEPGGKMCWRNSTHTKSFGCCLRGYSISQHLLGRQEACDDDDHRRRVIVSHLTSTPQGREGHEHKSCTSKGYLRIESRPTTPSTTRNQQTSNNYIIRT